MRPAIWREGRNWNGVVRKREAPGGATKMIAPTKRNLRNKRSDRRPATSVGGSGRHHPGRCRRCGDDMRSSPGEIRISGGS
jgi:hypothetical protein